MPWPGNAILNISAAENWPNSGRVRREFYGVSTQGGIMSKPKAKKRSSAAPERRRANQEETYYGLATSVALACDRFFERRGIVMESHCWTKRLDYLAEDSE
jgi:hypothetical protein